MLEGMPILWGDTVNGNIDRYVERYFVPALEENGIDYRWQDRLKQMTIGKGFTDFRSADDPYRWEGFGYRRVILNEAGIILGDLEGNKGPYLYTNAVLPMMADFPDSELFALGVPKGKQLRSGDEHPFFKLWKRVGKDANYRGEQFDSFANPFLSGEVLVELQNDIAAMAPGQEDQEVGAKFLDGVTGQKFAHKFDQTKHTSKPAHQIPSQAHYISLDFNNEPFCGIFAHIWEDQYGPHFWIFAEESIKEPTVSEMVHRIGVRVPHPLLIQMTGDKGGGNRRLGEKSAASLFDDVSRLLKLNSRQLELPPNPSHLKSREDCNYVLVHHPDVRIDPSCKGLIRDLLSVCVKPDGEIIKSDRKQVSQQADLLDAFRYLVNTYLRKWLTDHRRGQR